MKTPAARLAWKPCLVVAGFAAIAFGVLSVDSPVALAQDKSDKSAESKADAKAKRQAEINKAIEERQKRRTEKEKVAAPPVLRVTPGTGKKLDSVALAKIIDDEINRRLQIRGVKRLGKSADAEFFRRVRSISSASFRRRTGRRVSRQHRSREAHQDDRPPPWRHALRQVLRGTLDRADGAAQYEQSPAQRQADGQMAGRGFNKNTPLNKIVFDLLTAYGAEENAAVTYFVGNPSVDKITDNVSRMFLGVQLQCTSATIIRSPIGSKSEYWGMAQFFIKTRLNATPQQAAKPRGRPSRSWSPTQPNNKKGRSPIGR